MYPKEDKKRRGMTHRMFNFSFVAVTSPLGPRAYRAGHARRYRRTCILEGRYRYGECTGIGPYVQDIRTSSVVCTLCIAVCLYSI